MVFTPLIPCASSSVAQGYISHASQIEKTNARWKKLANPQAPKTIYVPSQFIEIQSRLIEMLVTDVAFHQEVAQLCTTLLPNRQQPSST